MIKLLTILILLSYKGWCKNTLKIGAIFNEQNQENERSFNNAVNEANLILNKDNYKFESVIEYVDDDDPFNAMVATCRLLQKNVIAILGPSAEHNFKIVQSICDDKDIPLLVVRSSDDFIASVINLYPDQQTLIRAYINIIDAWNFQDFVILYENNESLQRIGDLIQHYYAQKNKIVATELDRFGTGNYRPVLKEMLKSGATNFVIDCNIDVLEEVLRQIQQVSLMSEKYQFIITNLDLHTLDLIQYQYSNANITGIRFINPESGQLQKLPRDYFETDTDPLGFAGVWKIRLQALLIRDAVLMLAATVRELPKNFAPPQVDCNTNDPWILGSTTINHMHNMRYLGASGIVRFDTTGHRSNFTLDVIELMEGGIVQVGSWDLFSGLNIHRVENEIVQVDNRSLTNKSFKVLITILPPFADYKTSDTTLTGNDRFEGYSIDLIDELSKMEGFNYTFIVQADGSNGSLNKTTGEWSGMMGAIIDGSADLAIADLTITSERQEYVDFAAPYMTLGISILYHKPTKAPPGFFSFADPFALEVWELLAVAFFSVSVIFYILGRICSEEWSNPYPCIEEPEFLINQLSLRNCFWFTVSSLMQQGSEIGPVAISTRMVAAVWWFFTLIMVSSYTANLAAFLTKETPQPHFTNVYELVANADKHQIKWGAKALGSTVEFFEKKKHIIEFQKIHQYMMDHSSEVLVPNSVDGVIKAEKENYAFFMEITSIEYEIQRRCNLTAVGDLLDEKSYGIAMRKRSISDSSYRNIFSRAILQLQQSGKLVDLKRRWWEERRGGGLCSGDEDSSEATALGWKNVSGVFWVTIAGTLLACISVFIELILHVIKDSIKNKTPWKYTLIEELKFYFNFSGMVKPVIKANTSTDVDNHE